jgi:succinate dehydrogenase/fumarate reductase cytochrome b subunit
MAAVFHFCNGIVTFCITWGITVGDQARKRVGLAVAGLGLVLLTWGGLSIFALATSEPPAEDHDGAETQVVRNDYE